MPAHVLIIEDSPSMQAALGDLLAAVGDFSVAAIIPDETNATLWLQDPAHVFDVAIIDLLIDGGSGFNLVVRARKARPQAKIIVLSEFVSPAVAERCQAMGANAVFPKSHVREFGDYLAALAPGKQAA
jgi:DNA-binding NarL/FixJ family response regulator